MIIKLFVGTCIHEPIKLNKSIIKGLEVVVKISYGITVSQ